MSETKLNKPLIKKMIERMEVTPEAYAQETIISGIKQLHKDIKEIDVLPRPDPPCGAAGCLIAQAIICDAPSVRIGIGRLRRKADNADEIAADLMGVPYDAAWNLFFDWSNKWPEPHRSRFVKAKTYKGQSRAAVGLLKAILKTDGKILE